jgi:hypothetical protein
MDTLALGEMLWDSIILIGCIVVVIAAIVIFVLSLKRKQGIRMAVKKFFSTLFDNLPG